jgi:hypothetical protein
LEWSSSTDLESSDQEVHPADALSQDTAKAEKKAAKKAAKEKRRELKAAKFSEYLAQLRVDSPGLARDEEDLALAKNSYQAARISYKQRRDQWRARKVALNLARKQHKLALKKAAEEAASNTNGAAAPVEPSPDALELPKKEEKKLKKDKKKKKRSESDSSRSDSSESSESASGSKSASSSKSSHSHSSGSFGSSSGSPSGEEDSDFEDSFEVSSEDSDSLEFGPDGELLTREAAVNSKCDRAQFRLEVRSLHVVQKHARHIMKRKQKQLRKHYKSEKHQTSQLIYINKKTQKVESKRAERLAALQNAQEHQSPRGHHHAHHGHLHDHPETSPSADYKVVTESQPEEVAVPPVEASSSAAPSAPVEPSVSTSSDLQ